MQLQFTLFKPFSKFLLYVECFFFGSTMHNSIICISFKRRLWEISFHPHIKDIVQKHICQYWTNYTTLPFGLRCLWSAYPPCTPYIRFLFVRLRFRYPFFSPTPHDVNLGSRFGVRRQLRPSWTFTTD